MADEIPICTILTVILVAKRFKNRHISHRLFLVTVKLQRAWGRMKKNISVFIQRLETFF